MKKSLIKNNFKEIIKTRRRFISIMIMAFLGVGFFAGLTASSPDMLDSLDSYTDNNNMYDINIVSTLGLTDNDINTIKQIDGVENAYGIQTKDSLATLNDKENVCKIIEYNENINTPEIIYGKLPSNSNECLLDNKYTITENIENYIGKQITLNNNDLDENNNPIFTQKTFTITGIATTPIYISNERGNSSIGNGTISYFIYTKDDVINLNYYTEVGVHVKNTKELITNSNEYIEKINNVISKIDTIKEECKLTRYNELVAKANNKLTDSQNEYNIQKADVELELNNAKDELSKIEKATWYIQDRNDNIGYSNIFDAIKTMSNISKVFPVIFYLVAVLISLTSMARMIEEERIEIGTLKSLGYTNLQIISKYIIYSAIACILGGILGMSIGFYLLPTIVWNLYAMIYTLPHFHLNYQLGIGLAGTLIAFLCIGGTTILVAYKELKEMPSVLMRPKAPKNGKKIFLEKITFIWKHLNFSKKITTRNIFRYKKRAIMTIVGIAGCTGLMVTGFGIKDSIIDIPETQFGEIFKYNLSIAISDSNKLSNITSYINSHPEIDSYAEVCATTAKVKNNNGNFDVTIFTPNSNENFIKSCNLHDYQTKEQININQEGIIITDKVSEQLSLKVGDNVTLVDADNIEYNLKIAQIAENYVSHYIYMSKEYYEANIKTYKTNMILLNTKENITNTQLEKISEELLTIDGVASVSVISTLISSIEDMLGTLNYIVIILVVASALLAFVVLYNLANINIGERQRELATLKVLGFYDNEIDSYINKENIIFTIIGIALGLIFGFFLTSSVVISVEIDKLKFIRKINPISYIYSSLITIVFSFIVNKVIHFVLKKIDMIESLKSVE